MSQIMSLLAFLHTTNEVKPGTLALLNMLPDTVVPVGAWFVHVGRNTNDVEKFVEEICTKMDIPECHSLMVRYDRYKKYILYSKKRNLNG